MIGKLDLMWMGFLYGLEKWTRRKLGRAYGRYTRRLLRRQLEHSANWLS
jgi:hypothetical protein